MDNRFNIEMQDKISSLDGKKIPNATWDQQHSWSRIHRKKSAIIPLWFWYAAASIALVLLLLRFGVKPYQENVLQLAELRESIGELENNNCRLEEMLYEKQAYVKRQKARSQISRKPIAQVVETKLVYQTKRDTIFKTDTVIKVVYKDRFIEQELDMATQQLSNEIAETDTDSLQTTLVPNNLAQIETIYKIDAPDRNLKFSLFKRKKASQTPRGSDQKLLCLKIYED